MRRAISQEGFYCCRKNVEIWCETNQFKSDMNQWLTCRSRGITGLGLTAILNPVRPVRSDTSTSNLLLVLCIKLSTYTQCKPYISVADLRVGDGFNIPPPPQTNHNLI